MGDSRSKATEGQEKLPAVSSDEHRGRILAAIHPLPAERIHYESALGRTLAERVTSATAIPPFDNSSMDGYAVTRTDLLTASVDAPITLRVSADLPAGADATVEVVPGTAARIMTGAPIPPGADAIVPIEDTDGGTMNVTIRSLPAPSAWIRKAGADLGPGDLVLVPGITLRERHIAAAVSAGRSELLVHARPRVAVVSTGSELVRAGDPLAHGQIPDSNSPLLAAAVEQAGATAIRAGIVSDDEETLYATLSRYEDDVDAFLLSGGVSVGAFDVVKAVLAPLGVHFGPVRMQPGKPQGFGLWTNGVPIFALPGNPVSAFVSFEVFVRPALRTMSGCREVERRRVTAIAHEGWSCPPGRRQYIPVTVLAVGERSRADPVERVADDDHIMRVRPASRGGSGSHLVASLALADGLAVIDETVDRVHPGDRVSVMLLE